jgi:hypothetical protein
MHKPHYTTQRSKNWTRALLSAALMLAAAPASHAGILGDEVWCELHYPELGTILRGLRVYDVVETGQGDAFGLQWGAGATLDPEDDRLIIRVHGNYDFRGPAFNGFVLGDLDFAPGEVLYGLSLEDNTIGGFDETKFGFLSEDTIWINLAGTTPAAGDAATLRFVMQPIPEPARATTFAALGVLALAVCRRWRH